MQLNERFYHYTLHQQSQDPNPYSWPTPEQFRATIAWPRDRPNFQGGTGPTEAQGDEEGAEEDGDMANVMDFFL